MADEQLRARLFESGKDLSGLTGDGGETFCLFLRNNKNPLASGWKWFYTEDDAEAWAAENNIKIFPNW
jgi:hypothetical protein